MLLGGSDRATRKLMYVTTSLRVGGAQAMLMRIATARPAIADETVIVSLLPAKAYADRIRAAGVRVVELGFDRTLGLASGLFRLAKLIADGKPDIIQGWMYHGDLAALVALALSGRRTQTRLIWSIRNSNLDLRRYSMQLRLVVKACAALSSRPDLVTANSVTGMNAHLAMGYRPRQFAVVQNGIDTEEFKPDTLRRAALRWELGVAHNAIVVAHVARVDPMKDHRNFLAAMAHLPNLTGWMIGAGTENLTAGSNVRVFGYRSDVARLLAAADFVVSSSEFGEGFSNAIAEGMACGLPAIATDVGDARTIVGDTGIVVPPRAPELLVEAVQKLAMESPVARTQRAAAARERIVNLFSIAKARERFAALYESCLMMPERSAAAE